MSVAPGSKLLLNVSIIDDPVLPEAGIACTLLMLGKRAIKSLESINVDRRIELAKILNTLQTCEVIELDIQCLNRYAIIALIIDRDIRMVP